MGEKHGAAGDLRATVWIGKQGLTDSVVCEVVLQLEKRNRVKVKWLRNAEFDPMALAQRAGARLAMVRGRTAVYEKRNRGENRG